MKDVIKFLIGFLAGFVVVYKLLSKNKQEEEKIQELPFDSNGEIWSVLKRFNEMKQKI